MSRSAVRVRSLAPGISGRRFSGGLILCPGFSAPGGSHTRSAIWCSFVKCVRQIAPRACETRDPHPHHHPKTHARSAIWCSHVGYVRQIALRACKTRAGPLQNVETPTRSAIWCRRVYRRTADRASCGRLASRKETSPHRLAPRVPGGASPSSSAPRWERTSAAYARGTSPGMPGG